MLVVGLMTKFQHYKLLFFHHHNLYLLSIHKYVCCHGCRGSYLLLDLLKFQQVSRHMFDLAMEHITTECIMQAACILVC